MKVNEAEPLRRVTRRDYISDMNSDRRLTLPEIKDDTASIYTARLKLDPMHGCLYLRSQPPTEESLNQEYAADFLVDLTCIKLPRTNLLKKILNYLRGSQSLGSVGMHAIYGDQKAVKEPDVRLINRHGILLTKNFISNQLLTPLEVIVENGYFMRASDEGDFADNLRPTPGVERELAPVR
jgi:hypothetical protein